MIQVGVQPHDPISVASLVGNDNSIDNGDSPARVSPVEEDEVAPHRRPFKKRLQHIRAVKSTLKLLNDSDEEDDDNDETAAMVPPFLIRRYATVVPRNQSQKEAFAAFAACKDKSLLPYRKPQIIPLEFSNQCLRPDKADLGKIELPPFWWTCPTDEGRRTTLYPSQLQMQGLFEPTPLADSRLPGHVDAPKREIKKTSSSSSPTKKHRTSSLKQILGTQVQELFPNLEGCDVPSKHRGPSTTSCATLSNSHADYVLSHPVGPRQHPGVRNSQSTLLNQPPQFPSRSQPTPMKATSNEFPFNQRRTRDNGMLRLHQMLLSMNSPSFEDPGLHGHDSAPQRHRLKPPPPYSSTSSNGDPQGHPAWRVCDDNVLHQTTPFLVERQQYQRLHNSMPAILDSPERPAGRITRPPFSPIASLDTLRPTSPIPIEARKPPPPGSLPVYNTPRQPAMKSLYQNQRFGYC